MRLTQGIDSIGLPSLRTAKIGYFAAKQHSAGSAQQQMKAFQRLPITFSYMVHLFYYTAGVEEWFFIVVFRLVISVCSFFFFLSFVSTQVTRSNVDPADIPSNIPVAPFSLLCSKTTFSRSTFFSLLSIFPSSYCANLLHPLLYTALPPIFSPLPVVVFYEISPPISCWTIIYSRFLLFPFFLFHQRPDMRHTQVTFNVVFNPPLHTVFILNLETVIFVLGIPPSLPKWNAWCICNYAENNRTKEERDKGTVKDLDGRKTWRYAGRVFVSDELLSPPFDATVASFTFLIRLRMCVCECVKELGHLLVWKEMGKRK